MHVQCSAGTARHILCVCVQGCVCMHEAGHMQCSVCSVVRIVHVQGRARAVQHGHVCALQCVQHGMLCCSVCNAMQHAGSAACTLQCDLLHCAKQSAFTLQHLCAYAGLYAYACIDKAGCEHTVCACACKTACLLQQDVCARQGVPCSNCGNTLQQLHSLQSWTSCSACAGVHGMARRG